MAHVKAYTVNVRLPGRVAVLGVSAFLCLSGCTNIPELDETVPKQLEKADYPQLVPIETLLIPLPAPEEQEEELRTDLTNRRDSLQSRASQLNTTVVDAETQARMKAGVTP